MHRKIGITSVIFFIFLGSYNYVEAQETPINKTIINLCADTDQNYEGLWTNNVNLALNRLSYGCYKTDKMSYEVLNLPSKCPDIPGGSCYGENGKVICNKAILARVLLSQAWMAAGYIIAMENDRAGLKATLFTGIDTLALADAQLSRDTKTFSEISKRIITTELNGNHETFTKIENLVSDLQYFDMNPDLDPSSVNPLALFAYSIYEPATNYLIAFILGHELSHAHSYCWMEEQSSIEKNGLFENIINKQAEGIIFCPNPILLDELKADQCALRIVQFMDESYSKCIDRQFTERIDLLATNFFLSVGRRHAIDQLGLLFAIGLAQDSNKAIHDLGNITNDGMRTISYVAKIDRGYIIWPLRLLMFSEQLRQREFISRDLVGICGQTARKLVLGMNLHLALCMDKENEVTKIDHTNLPDNFKTFVPPGVVNGWKTGFWDDRPDGSFHCPINESRIAFDQALSAYRSADYKGSLPIFQKLAEEGHVEAEFFLGKLYFDGSGTARDYTSAKYWFQRASNAGHLWASYYLGAIFLNLGDDVEGEKWLQLAMNSGIKKVEALHLLKKDRSGREMFDIGLSYIKGDGVRRDSIEAEKWFQKAGEAGFKRAWFNIGLMHSRGDGVPKNIQKAITYLEKCLDDSDAKFVLGNIYLQGDGVPQDINKAFSFFKEAAADGNIRAKIMSDIIDRLQVNIEDHKTK